MGEMADYINDIASDPYYADWAWADGSDPDEPVQCERCNAWVRAADIRHIWPDRNDYCIACMEDMKRLEQFFACFGADEKADAPEA